MNVLIMRCLAVVLLIPILYLNVKAINAGYYKPLRMKVSIAVCVVYAILLSTFMYNEYLSSSAREVKANADVSGFIDDEVTLDAIPKSLCEQLVYWQDTMLDLSDIVKQKETVKTDAEVAELKEHLNTLHAEVMTTKTEITKRNNMLFLFACVVLSLGIIYKILCWWPDLYKTYQCVKTEICKYFVK